MLYRGLIYTGSMGMSPGFTWICRNVFVGGGGGILKGFSEGFISVRVQVFFARPFSTRVQV